MNPKIRWLGYSRTVPDAADILDHLTHGVIVVDAGLRVRYLNQAAENLVGQSAPRCAGQPLLDFVTDPGETVDVLRTALTEGQPFTKREARLVGPLMGEIRANYSVQPFGDDGLLIEIESLDRIMRIGRDEEHVSLQETTRKLVRGLAHEIKNPLGGIRGAAQLLERALDSDAHRDYTNIIIEEADRLRNLVDRMLGPNELPRLAPVNVHHVLERVVQLVDAECPQRIAFVRDYDPSVPEIEADFERLLQALLNVLRNAKEALEGTERPEIELSTRVIRQFTIGAVRHRLVVKIDVVDNGPGIPPDIADRIYYPMISGRPDGTGLGLAITQNIIGQHHGVLECESEPGRTVFSVFLPLEQPSDVQ